jgi:RNA polymerase sigma-70 factor (ECF subfamily)
LAASFVYPGRIVASPRQRAWTEGNRPVKDVLEEYVPQIYRFALRLTHDPHAAEDLTQETVLRAWRGRGRLRQPQAVRVWLFRITVNLWRDQLRRGQSRIAQAGPLPDDHAGSTPAPDRQAAGQEDVRRALAALDRLPERQREVLYLNTCQGLSAAEIATILGIHPDAVKASLCLARKKLREQLHDLFEDLFPTR